MSCDNLPIADLRQLEVEILSRPSVNRQQGDSLHISMQLDGSLSDSRVSEPVTTKNETCLQ